jgi:hypothetical protein
MTASRSFAVFILLIVSVTFASLAGCGWGGTPITADPTISLPGGTYSSSQTVAIADSDPGASILYTTDGTAPGASSTLYSHPITVASSLTLQAVAITKGFAPSAVVSATYAIAPATPTTAAAPTFNPPAGTYPSAQTVSLTDTTPNATIFYTTNGATPTTASTQYTGSFTVSSTATVQAIATAPNYTQSPIASATYTITLPTAAAPTFNPPAGTYSSTQTVSLTDTTPNATIFYTTNGATPTTASTQYTAPFSIASTATVEAIATAPNYLESPVAVATYTIGTQPSGKGMWTWMGGSTTYGEAPVYGTLGVPSSANTPGGNGGGLTFPGPNGTFLLFGGSDSGNTVEASALWQYNPATSEWTWIAGPNTTNAAGVYGTQGVPSTANQPPPRTSSATWSDSAGNRYFFGGGSYFNGTNHILNDFWSFNTSSYAFTWIDGSDQQNDYGSSGTIGVAASTNVPSARDDTGSCSDNRGNLWMFGGGGPYPPLGNIGYLNDLWQFNPATGNWTWYTGSQQVNQPGIYGTLGTPSPTNTPGSRLSMECWTALDGKLWFFAGYGFDISSSDQGILTNNDLWTFDPTTLQWTWVGGSSIHNQIGVYGTLGQPATTNNPGARWTYSHWTDQSGDLWLFGGAVMNPYYNTPILANDLWRYNIASGQWTWMSGTPSGPISPYSVYGTLGIPAPANTPGARDGAVTWVDTQGNLWLFGGYGYDPTGNAGPLSDLWRYQP